MAAAVKEVTALIKSHYRPLPTSEVERLTRNREVLTLISIARRLFKSTYLVQEPDKSVPPSGYALLHSHAPGVLDNSLW